MKRFNWKKQNEIFTKVEKLIGNQELYKVSDLFEELFGNDTNYIHAVVLTESNPEYAMQSKQFYKLLYEFYIDKLLMNIDKHIKRSNENNKN